MNEVLMGGRVGSSGLDGERVGLSSILENDWLRLGKMVTEVLVGIFL